MEPEVVTFVFNLIRSGIISDEQGRYLFREHRESGISNSLDDVCKFLIEKGAITNWQCDKLKQRKWKGFFLDHYLMLEQDGKGADYSSYRSRDTRDGSIVRLVVTPTVLTDGRIEYKVERDIE